MGGVRAVWDAYARHGCVGKGLGGAGKSSKRLEASDWAVVVGRD